MAPSPNLHSVEEPELYSYIRQVERLREHYANRSETQEPEPNEAYLEANIANLKLAAMLCAQRNYISVSMESVQLINLVSVTTCADLDMR